MKCAYCMTEFSQKIDICPECGFNQHDKPSLWWNLYGLFFPPFCWVHVTTKWKKPKSPKLRCARFISYGILLNVPWYILTRNLFYTNIDALENFFSFSPVAGTIAGLFLVYIEALFIPTLWIVLASWLFSPKRQYKPGMEFYYT